MIRCFIGLGSNLNEPLLQVQQACDALAKLPECHVDSISPWYKSKAIGPGQQPDYINGVAQLTTSLPPIKLLHRLQHIENQQHRQRNQRWGPRTLDLDLLVYGDQVINSAELTVPHPRIYERNFVLFPLADIAPQLIFPDGTSLLSLLDCCSREGLTLTGKIITERPIDQPGQL